jgi:hypothetical protein
MPVLKPNEAMIEQAAARGRRIGLLSTFEPTLASMAQEFPRSTVRRTQIWRRMVGRAVQIQGEADDPNSDKRRQRSALRQEQSFDNRSRCEHW